MSGKIRGQVLKIGDVIETGNTDLIKILIEYEAGDYIKELEITFFNDKIIDYILEDLNIDDFVEVDYNVESRKGKQGGYFTSCNGWRLNIIDDYDDRKRAKSRNRGNERQRKREGNNQNNGRNRRNENEGEENNDRNRKPSRSKLRNDIV